METSFRRAVAEARRQKGLYFAGVLTEERIDEAFGIASAFWQGWIYTPAVTMWVFLAQRLSADHSCVEAVAGLIAWRLARGLATCSAMNIMILRRRKVFDRASLTRFPPLSSLSEQGFQLGAPFAHQSLAARGLPVLRSGCAQGWSHERWPGVAREGQQHISK